MKPAQLRRLGGRVIPMKELAPLARKLPIDAALAKVLTSIPLVGVALELTRENDRSELGASFEWMDAKGILSEATQMQPGILAVPCGYVPVAMCLTGSGDYYYFRNRDGAFVRIPHESAVGGVFDEAQVEVVTASIAELLKRAEP